MILARVAWLLVASSLLACQASGPEVPSEPLAQRLDARPAARPPDAARGPAPELPDAIPALAQADAAPDLAPSIDAQAPVDAEPGPKRAVARPYIFLNKAEIDAIAGKVAEGASPWREAYAKAVQVANEALGTGPFILPEGYNRRWCNKTPSNYPYDHHRHVSRDFGHRLVTVALAWHLSKDAAKRAQYLAWAKRNLTSWFLDPRTGMLPEGCTVGINASFPVVLYGVDLIWPALDDAIKAPLLAWMRTFHDSVKSKVEFGGVGGNHNRADWWVLMVMVSGLVAEMPDVVDLGRQHLEKRTVAPDGSMSVGGAGVDSLADYTFFATTALSQIAEVCRHHGTEAYEIGKIDGRSKLERIWDRMTPFAFDPKGWTAATGNVPARESYFSGINLFSWELAYAYKGKDEYLKLVQRQGRPLWNWVGGHTDNSLGPLTLTHARGTYPFGVVSP